MRRLLLALVLAGSVLGATVAPAVAHSPIGVYWNPGEPDLCNVTSIEAHAEEHSMGHADNGFDQIGYPGYAGKSGLDPVGGNDCYDTD